MPTLCLADKGFLNDLIGQWVARDEQSMLLRPDKDGKLIVLGDEDGAHGVLARQASLNDGLVFIPASAGTPLFGSAKWKAHLHGDYLILTRMPADLPPDTYQARPGQHPAMVWRRASVPWPRYICQVGAWQFQLHWEADFKASIRFRTSDGSAWRTCALGINGLSYCPGCRSISESQPYVVTDQCRDEPVAAPFPDPIALRSVFEPGMNVEPHFRFRGDFSSIDSVYVRDGQVVVPCQLAKPSAGNTQPTTP